MSHNSSRFSKDQKSARLGAQGKTPKLGKLPVQRHASHETSANIQSSINHLMERNVTLFGPAGHNFYNPLAKHTMANKKKDGGDSGAPHNGQPTAAQFFNFGPVPQGPVGFYMHGGTHLPEAFPQQPPSNMFFSGTPWTANLGQMAFGGQPCLECGGYMQMGGINQYGGVNDGSMDMFASGGNWIQKATDSIKKRGTEGKCTGSKFGGPGCPPGSKAYNLAKTFRAMAKKAYGGTTDGIDQDDYTANRANDFNNIVRMNFGMAAADKQADRLQQEYAAMNQDASIANMPSAAYGYNMGYGNNLYAEGPERTQQAYDNYNMAQDMLDQMNTQSKRNTNKLFNAFNQGVANTYAPGNQYVKWDLKKTTFDDGGWAALKNSPEYIHEKRYNKYLGEDESYDRDFMNTVYKDAPWNKPKNTDANRYPGPYMRNQQGYPQNRVPYWISQNGQTRYDYNTPEAWYNVNQHPTGGGYWNTPGWNTPNMFGAEMFGDPNLTTRLSDIMVKRGLFGSMNNPRKVKMHFNTYINPQTGRIEVVPTTTANNTPAAGPAYGPQNKAADYDFMKDVSSKQLPGPRAEFTPDTPKSERQQKIEEYMKNMYTPNGVNNYVAPQSDANYDFMKDVQQNQTGPRAAFGGFLPMAAFGYNMYGQADPRFMGPLSPEYEQTVMGPQPGQPAQQAQQAQQATPSGGYDLTGKRKTPWSGQDIYGVTMGILGVGTNLALGDEKRKMEEYMAKQTMADNLFSAAGPYRGNITQTGAGYGTDFGGTQQTPPGAYTKNGGYVYAKGGAIQTGVPVELSDEEIEELRKAGHKIDFI